MLFFILTAEITIPTEFFVSIYWMSLILSVSNAIRTYNHIVYKRTLNHLAKLANLAKWLSVHLRAKWLWIRIALPSLKIQLWRLLWTRSSSTFKQTIECGFTLKTDMWHDNNIQSVILTGKFISLKPSLFAKSFQILWFFLDYGLPDLNIWPTTI